MRRLAYVRRSPRKFGTTYGKNGINVPGGMGPFVINYVNPADDSSKQTK